VDQAGGLYLGVHSPCSTSLSSLKGRGFVKTLATWDCAGFRPPCGRHRVRAGVKTERPQRSEDERS
jgi:hypothetical protein